MGTPWLERQSKRPVRIGQAFTHIARLARHWPNPGPNALKPTAGTNRLNTATSSRSHAPKRRSLLALVPLSSGGATSSDADREASLPRVENGAMAFLGEPFFSTGARVWGSIRRRTVRSQRVV